MDLRASNPNPVTPRDLFARQALASMMAASGEELNSASQAHINHAYDFADLVSFSAPEDEPYDPPYEKDENKPEPKPTGEGKDFREERAVRTPDLPDATEKDDSPRGGVDRRGQSGDQGDDDLKDFKDGE